MIETVVRRFGAPSWFMVLSIGGIMLVSTACQDVALADVTSPPTASPAPTIDPTATQMPIEQHDAMPVMAPPTLTPRPTSTPIPTPSATPTPTSTPTPTLTPTPTPIGDCADRIPNDGLTTLVTLQYGISKDYVPPSLAPLANHLPITVTLGYPTQMREIAVEPLTQMIAAMHGSGLRPTIISGYRSYAAQSIAWNKWQTKHPDRVSIISAPPGHSEHQLGTTVDFGSPELPALVGDEDIEFHTNFYMTAEGQWLAGHAHEYGFVLSFPRETFELTGMYYEPWHFRYVGVELAARLREQDRSLISYLLDSEPPPCIP
ncbi:MAG: M15 family metallopeptidase [Chloroflexota bacterium]|nr:MAG: M15 family metallopeptidase [Chloroflexota bacterium]